MTLPYPAARRWRVGVLTAAVATAVAFGAPATAAPAEGQILMAGGATAVDDSYIVVFKDTSVGRTDVTKKARDLAGRHRGAVNRTYQNALRGFEARMSEAEAKRLAADPSVRYVQQNHTMRISGTQSPTPSWGLDRLDQRALPLNNSYTYPNTGSGVKAYIIDTGIRFGHSDFGGRAVTGFDSIDGGSADDCNGHGTHVAGTVGGTAYGVAKGVTLVGVRVLDCEGSGTDAGVIQGVDWVTGDHAAGQLAVANMSLGGGFSQALNDAVARSIADGVTYGLAAGNDYGANACNSSPASLLAGITVGSTTNTDARSSFSNIGTCLDIFAPGSSITSAWHTSNTATNSISGTSMATPHVVGAAALVLAANPTFTPQQVRDKLVADATSNAVTSPGTGSPNKLLYVGDGGTTPPPPPPPTGCTQTNGTDVTISDNATVESTITIAGCTGTAGSASTVAVQIVHTYIGDLAVSLVAPDGSAYTLHNRTGGSADNINQTYTVNLSSEVANGTWKLRVQDAGAGDTGYVNSWTLNLGGSGTTNCTGTNANNVTVNDNATVTSSIVIAGCTGTASSSSKVAVQIVHTYVGDLVVSLVAPDGSAYTLHNRTGASADNINQTYTVNLSTETRNGTWKLRVQDAASGDTGYIDGWTLTL
ncbi:proprotein convertase P-domain-containing protein [Micromonospora sp. DSM 115977]|uniref:Proprotein convertase P-domain-containing protein n=1 Tax=Micromonospora reichwaldensis TaxID=3075516 RepID=A0ABU2X2M8_9ACTN|nr:proprotein convertase P-domain-containing protein [Micromonospora sp. DSM 115977]MDT0532454.1 proprotein convertase P-domain-containing protein [Micromonospora sp. DSM 115977]